MWFATASSCLPSTRSSLRCLSRVKTSNALITRPRTPRGVRGPFYFRYVEPFSLTGRHSLSATSAATPEIPPTGPLRRLPAPPILQPQSSKDISGSRRSRRAAAPRPLSLRSTQLPLRFTPLLRMLLTGFSGRPSTRFAFLWIDSLTRRDLPQFGC